MKPVRAERSRGLDQATWAAANMLLLPGRQGASRGVGIVQPRDALAGVVAETRPLCEGREDVPAGNWLARFAACPADFHFMACEWRRLLGVYNPPQVPPSLPLLDPIMFLLSGPEHNDPCGDPLLHQYVPIYTGSQPPIRTRVPQHAIVPRFPVATPQSDSAHHDIKPERCGGQPGCV